MDVPRITDVGDTAFNIEFGDAIDPAVNARVMSLCRAVRARRQEGGLAGLVEIVPTFRSALVCYDPLATSRAEIAPAVLALAGDQGETAAVAGRRWRIPVCYGGPYGPDLEEVAKACGLSPGEVVARHADADYFVYMLGFMPGFAYLGGLPEALRLPRRATPRLTVPAGSVAIAEQLAAVYPWESPGGWHLLGRSPAILFDLGRTPPSLLAAGDRVRFHPIDATEFAACLRDPDSCAPDRLRDEDA